MKNSSLSRLELLQWLNEFTECDYPKVEMLCDGIGFSQVIDAIHPGSVNLMKMNLNARYADEYALNLKMLNEVLKKLKIEKIVPYDKLCKGKFQDNINFLQWLYNYASRFGPLSAHNYQGYEKRLEALSKQQRYNKNAQINNHLIPNNAFLNFQSVKTVDQSQQNIPNQFNSPKQLANFQFDQAQQPAFQHQQQPLAPQLQHQLQQQLLSAKQVNQPDIYLEKQLLFVDHFLNELELELKNKMEYNWKILYALDDIIYQRNTLFQILTEIEQIASKFEPSPIKHTLFNILGNSPPDFQKA